MDAPGRWWIAAARSASTAKIDGEQRKTGAEAVAARSAAGVLVAQAEGCLEEAASSHSMRKLRVSQARKHLWNARVLYIGARCLEEVQEALEKLDGRIREADEAANAAEAGDDAMVSAVKLWRRFRRH